MAAFKFIKPAEPIRRQSPPSGDAYIHECKWDGFRAQLHKSGKQVHIFSRNGNWLPRFKPLLEPLSRFPAKSLIIDAEFIALNDDGLPDFRALIGGQSHNLACMCFDLMELNEQDMRPLTLVKRRQTLRNLFKTAAIPELSFSEDYNDPEALLSRLNTIGMEGIVSKLKHQSYISGRNAGWIKVKCHAWRAANTTRNKLFSKNR